MKILFVTSRLPYPPYRGDKVRTYNFLKALAREHEVHLVSFCESRRDFENSKHLQVFCAKINLVYLPSWFSWLKVFIALAENIPSQVAYYRSKSMRRMLWRVTVEENFDLAYLHLFRMHQYKQCLPLKLRKVVDLTDVISKELFRSVGLQPFWKIYFRLREAKKIRNYERKIVDENDEIWVISEKEKEDLLRGGVKKREVMVVQNGIVQRMSIRIPEDNLILYFGYSRSEHNKTALKFLEEKILPDVVKEIGGVRLCIIGAGKWSKRKSYNQVFPAKNLGFMDDLGEIFSLCSVMVAPLMYSAGTQNKILEAMNYGVPVITSSFGNEGIQATDKTQVIICDEPQSYVRAICALLKNPDHGELIGREGQNYVRSKFSWDDVTNRARVIEKSLKT